MKHATIFTRLAQRTDPNIPILEAAMDEIAQLEEQIETSGYSPFTEEVEDILRSEISKRDARIAELEEDKASLVRNCNQSFDAMQGQQETIEKQATRIKELEQAIEAKVIEKLKAQGVAAWLSIDSIGERYLCFSKPADNDTVFELYTLHEGD